MASGDTLFELFPQGYIPTTTVFGTTDTINDGSTVVGVLPTIDFAGATADESADWTKKMPSHYDGGGLSWEVDYAMDGTDGSDVQFEIRADKLVATDAIGSQNLGAQTATDITDTPNGTADVVDTTPTGAITHANAGSPAAGDTVRMRLTRDYDHAANADDAQVLSVLVKET